MKKKTIELLSAERELLTLKYIDVVLFLHLGIKLIFTYLLFINV